MNVFTMLGNVIDELVWGTDNVQAEGDIISYTIADETVLKDCIVPLCEECADWSGEIADSSIGYTATINFGKARGAWQIESITFTNDYGRTKTYSVDLSDLTSENYVEELYHMMCYQIAVMSV